MEENPEVTNCILCGDTKDREFAKCGNCLALEHIKNYQKVEGEEDIEVTESELNYAKKCLMDLGLEEYEAEREVEEYYGQY